MSYRRADEILPENILEILQTYVKKMGFVHGRERDAPGQKRTDSGTAPKWHVHKGTGVTILSDGKEHTADSQGNEETSYRTTFI